MSIISGVSQPVSTSRPLTLHLVRHGRTQYNDEGRLQGWCDSPLTEAGRHGVDATVQYLRKVPFVAGWTSPSGRTRHTAELILAEHPGLAAVVHPGLREFGYGEFEAQPEPVLYGRIPPHELYRDVFSGTFPGLPGGESGRAYLGRVAATFAEIEWAHPGGGDVLVVSHGVTLLAYLAMVVDTPLRPLMNASVSTVLINEDGTRSPGIIGHQTSSSDTGQLGPELMLNHVSFVEAASWAAADTVTA